MESDNTKQGSFVMKSATLLLSLVLAAFSNLVSADDNSINERCDTGLTIYVAGEYSEAFEVLKAEADKGLDCAQHWVARMYQLGHGTPMNRKLSKNYYELAARQGYEQSILQLELLKGH
jgi:TPR repeat protein